MLLIEAKSVLLISFVVSYQVGPLRGRVALRRPCRPPPIRSEGLDAGSLLFGSGYGFGGAFAYARQVAAFAARITHPHEMSPSTGVADPPRQWNTPKAS
ncbi:MAG: hypothetical protein ACM3VT_00725 [Solirubrobacterales bacterium]